ncbi:hypothetical protein [Winogradskya humida]|uniref:Uncharacterized protein n=1 Tax=Winogradskya humida TaxID=113566 RepID=A0ABQ3ZPC1_9ACTN|nr:hypothetical protein [Actinoplanes humidus]GIE20440.1 hypothetical protein Ahu01nite_035420 [Actinoplanes humidus]
MREEPTAAPSRPRRRKQAVAGVAGLAALGVGAFLVTSQLTDNDKTEPRDTAALAPVGPAVTGDIATAEPSASESAPASVAASESASAAPAAKVTTSPASVKEQIEAVRKAARQPNNQVRRPLNQPAVPVKDSELKVQATGVLKKDRETLKVVSAKKDLSGQRELSWVADEGEVVGDARCTQKFQFSAGAPVVDKPTLLVCWRTSASKSAYTVAVNLDGKPSTDKSIAALNKEWNAIS